MNEVFKEKSLYLVGGPGGVGKTTLAAALGVRFAMMGYKTVVLTVDPARRLAQALGFEGFKDELQAVPIPGYPEASLHATMLDTQRYFDKIIDRFAKHPEQKDKILANPIYRAMVDSLGGTQEYAAMERLLEFANDQRFDRIIVDTPPTQNAVDLLSAPQRLADFMDNSVIKWFQGPKPFPLQIFKQGTRLAMKVIQKIFGAEFLESFASFMDDFEGLQAGFRKRNLEVIELLRSPRTAFLLVTFPSEVRFLESLAFVETLKAHQIPLSALVLNRIEPACSVSALPGDVPEEGRQEVDKLLAYYAAISKQQQHWVDAFTRELSAIPLFLIPKQGPSLHDVTRLSQLGEFLVK